MTRARRIAVAIGVTALVLLVLGVLSPARRGDGLERYESDPLAYAVAAHAYRNAGILLDHPATRLFVRARRVTRVWREPGHCTQIRPNEAESQYRATVRTYTWLGLPGPAIEAECGGWYVRW